MRRTIVCIAPFLFVAHVHAQQPDTLQSVSRRGVSLGEVVVTGDKDERDVQLKSSQSLVKVDRSYLEAHFAGSLMQSLEAIPGVKAMSIGAGQSKPAIRGLGFNRMVVTIDGIKHEGQQWGDDHGLEVDQFAIDRVEIVKGPGALLYGSDAIGGVINLYDDRLPAGERAEGQANLFTQSNNGSIGTSIAMAKRKNHFFFKGNLTLITYADYRIPTDSIEYYSYWIKLKDRRLRNTAGREYDGSFMTGYEGKRWKTTFSVSNNYARSGFFANAHGLEVRLSEIDYDRSIRDIDLPYQTVNHLTVMNRTSWQTGDMHFDASLAWQNNHRRELSEPVSHGYMPIPSNTLERSFDKDTYTANLGMKTVIGGKHSLSTGASMEYQHNRRGGWNFIIPDFDNVAVGLYAFDRYHLSDDLIISAGIRYDHTHTHIRPYNDWYKTPVESGSSDSVYMQRAIPLSRSFNSLTWSVGANWNLGHWMLKANVGKSFRIPIAKELGTDGINYNIFRYEQGTPTLSPEEAYEVDAGIHYDTERLSIQVDPYVNYFTNYIYLNPTPAYREGLQLCRYTQCRVLRYGFEATATYRFSSHWETQATAEYLHARQLSGEKKGYTLPFSPPPSGSFTVKYQWGEAKTGTEGFASATVQVTADQNEIVPPEKATPGHALLNLNAGKGFVSDRYRFRISLQARNLLNTRYYDHTSYYRLIDVPEPGRNIALILGMEF